MGVLALAALHPGALSAGIDRVGGELGLSEASARFPAGPTAAFAPDGTFLVVWSQQDSGSGFARVGRRFDRGGNPLGASFRIGETRDSQGPPRLVGLPDGGFVVAWTQSGARGTESVRMLPLGPDGAPRGGEVELRPRVPDELIFVNAGGSWLTATRDGELVLVWDSEWMFRLIEGQRFSAQGKPLGERFVVNTSSARPVQPAVAATASGGFVVAWSQSDPDVTREDGIMVRPYGARKQPTSLEIAVTRDDAGINVRDVVVAARPDGTLLVIARKLRGTRLLGLSMAALDEHGRRLGPAVRVDGSEAHQVLQGPVGAVGSDGHAVIAWAQHGGGAIEGLDVVARVVEPEGGFSGPPFVVNSRTGGSQADAVIATGPGGEVLVVWVDFPEQGDWSVRGQLFQLTR